MSELIEFWTDLGFLNGVDEEKKNVSVENVRKPLIF